MTRIVLRLLFFVIAITGIIYLGDYLSLRYRISHNRDPYGTVIVRPVYVIHEKNGQVEYDVAAPQSETCVHSLFPHLGCAPCWYVAKHTEKQIDI